MTLVFSVGLLWLKDSNNLAKWLLPLPFSLGKSGTAHLKAREVILHAYRALTGHQGSCSIPRVQYILVIITPDPQTSWCNCSHVLLCNWVTVLTLNNCELVFAWQMSSLSLGEWGGASSYSLHQDWAASVSQLLAWHPFYQPSRHSPNTRPCEGQGHHPGPWSWETEHVSVLPLWIHFTDQEHIVLLFKYKGASRLLKGIPNLPSEESSRRDGAEQEGVLFCLGLFLHVGSISVR